MFVNRLSLIRSAFNATKPSNKLFSPVVSTITCRDFAKQSKSKWPGPKPPPTLVHHLFKVSPELAAVINTDTVSRANAVKMIWDYIKKNNLRDTTKPGQIILDKKMKKVFDGESIIKNTTIMKGLSKHITKEKVGTYTKDQIQEMYGDKYDEWYAWAEENPELASKA